jgi:ATP-dependent Clp protease ATP-binding subunit ClpA
LADRLSKHAHEILQSATQRAAELDRHEVDTEHLLYALTGSDVVRTILDQFKVSVDELRAQLEKETPRGDAEHREDVTEIGVSPRLKDALTRALRASAELGHSYVGPEHLLIGLAEEGEGLASDLLRRYGLTTAIELSFDASLVDYLAREGYRPEFGARELRRLIRSEIETQLARSMLVGEVRDGDRVLVRWDDDDAKVRFERQPAAKPAEQATPAAAEARVH